MKIKQEKKLNLPQLIEWAWENNITNLSFRGHGKEGHLVVASFNDRGEFTSEWCISKDDIFEIEVEEEIDEDTEIDRLVVIDDDDDLLVFSNYTIKEIKNNDFKEYHAYIDGEFKLIWTHEKGMVE